MKIVLQLSEDNFDEVLENKLPTLVLFWADWCSTCKLQSPIFYEMASDLKDRVIFAKVNLDENPLLSQKYKVSSVPTVLLFYDGRVVAKSEGLCTKAEFAEMLIKYV